MSTQVTTSSNAKVVVWGNQIGLTYTSDTVNIAPADSLPQTATFTRDGDEQEIRDSVGEVQTFVTYNLRETLDVEVIPVGSSATEAALNNIAPAKGTLVTVTDTSGVNADNTRIAGGTSGNEKKYICISSTQTNSNTSEVRISMSLRRYAADVATAGT